MTQNMLFSGSSLQQAILAAARHFRLDADAVAYRVRDQRQGLVRGRQRIVIEVDPASPQTTKHETPPSQAPVRPEAPRPPATAAPASPRLVESQPRREPAQASPRPIPQADLPVAVGPEAEAVQMVLQYLAALAGVDLQAEIRQGVDGLHVDLGGGAHPKRVVEDAALLEAVEQLLPRAVRGLHGAPIPLMVDVGGVREKLLEDLRRLALETAATVRTTGQSVTLEEMNPADRRIVHLTLADDLSVATESLGGGVIKRILVRPR